MLWPFEALIIVKNEAKLSQKGKKCIQISDHTSFVVFFFRLILAYACVVEIPNARGADKSEFCHGAME